VGWTTGGGNDEGMGGVRQLGLENQRDAPPILPNFDGCTVQIKFWDGGNPMDGDESLDNWNRKGSAKSA
jgi:hypothetical protein